MNEIIYLLLLSQGIESNPGPNNISVLKPNLSVRTFNCNGLGNINKLRRLFAKVNKEVSLGGIVMLQETHLKNENQIKLYWKMNYAANGISTQSAGVIILYDNSYKCIESYSDAMFVKIANRQLLVKC